MYVADTGNSRVLGFDGKRLHLHQQLLRGEDDAVVATAEQMLLHVDSNAGRTCPAEGPLRTRLARLAAAQAGSVLVVVGDGAGDGPALELLADLLRAKDLFASPPDAQVLATLLELAEAHAELTAAGAQALSYA